MSEITPAGSLTKIFALIEEFILRHDVKPSSKITYKKQLRQFGNWVVSTGREGTPLVREDIVAFRDDMAQIHTSTTTGGYLTAVKKFFAWLESERLYPNVAMPVKLPKKPKGHRKDLFSKEQLREALDGIDRSTPNGLRDYAIFNLMARTGLRTIEVARAKIEDIRQLSGSPVLWIQGKSRDDKDEFVKLNEAALAPIQVYLKTRGQTKDRDPLFASCAYRNTGEHMTTRSISRIIKNTLLAAGIDSNKLTAHSLRHTAISLALLGKASLHQAQAMARHADPRTTMIYVHNLNRIDEAAEDCINF